MISGLDDSPPRARWGAFAISVAVTCLTLLDLSKVNVALPAIEQGLGASTLAIQLIVAGYALAIGLTLVPAGRLGDVGSRRSLFIVGLISFGALSFACGIAPNAPFLVIARVAQGVSAGFILPQVLGLIQQLFHGRERGMALGLFGAIVGLSTAFGPALGGLLIELGGHAMGWRLSFWINVPIAIVLLPFAIKMLPRKQEVISRSLDIVGVFLLGLSVLCLMLPFVLTTGGDQDDPWRWLILLGFVAAATAFYYWERGVRARGKDPVLDFDLLSYRSYRYGVLIGAGYFSAVPGLFLVVTLYLQQGLGLSAVMAGLVSVPFALVSAYTSWLTGRWVHLAGHTLVSTGLVTFSVGIVLVLLAATLPPPELSPWLVAAGLLVAGAGGGAVVTANQTLLLSEVPVSQGGVAGSFGQVGQRVGTAIGTAAVLSTFYAAIERDLGDRLHLDVYRNAISSALVVALGFAIVSTIVAFVTSRPARRA